MITDKVLSLEKATRRLGDGQTFANQPLRSAVPLECFAEC